MSSLGPELDAILKSAGVKRADLAASLGVSRSTVSQWLNEANACAEPYLARIVSEYSGSEAAPVQKETLLRLFVLALERRIESATPDDGVWSPRAIQLSRAAVKLALDRLPPGKPSACERTLRAFPDAFLPMAVVVGDKREESETRISAADFGAHSASPAELRYVLQLGLREAEIYTDKIFRLESTAQLKKRFSERNLLVIGSPASCHLHRMILHPPKDWRDPAPIYRFNMPGTVLQDIEAFTAGLLGKNRKQLVGMFGEADTQVSTKVWMRQLFSGGIVDPGFRDLWLRAVELRPNRDFGLLSLARNPFAETDEFVCILAAGFHMFGTAYAIQMLSKTESFTHHPLGGVIRVDIPDDANDNEHFGARFDESVPTWDTPEDTGAIETVKAGLLALQEKPPVLPFLSSKSVEGSLELIESVAPSARRTRNAQRKTGATDGRTTASNATS